MNPLSKLLGATSLALLIATLFVTSLYYKERASLAKAMIDVATFRANAKVLTESLDACSNSVDAAKREADAASKNAEAAIEEAKKGAESRTKSALDYVKANAKDFSAKKPLTSTEAESCGAADALLNRAIEERHAQN